MNCPFCQSLAPNTARACRVCGGPLRAATKPTLAPISAVAAPTLLARHTFDENAAHLINTNFVPDDNPLICLMRSDSTVKLWDAHLDKISSFSVKRRFKKSSPICCALATPNFAATGYENGEVRWHKFDGREMKSSAPHVGSVLALASNATHFYSGGNDGVIWATALEDNRKVASCALLEGLGAMTTFAVSLDATLIAVGCDDGAVELWRVNAQQNASKLDWTRRGHSAPIASLSFSPNGKMIVSRDKAGNLGLWAAQTSYQLPLAPPMSGVAPAFSGDNRWLAVANASSGVDIYDVALGGLLHQLPPLAERITHLAFDIGTTRLFAASAQEIMIWEIP